jgi:Nucleotidyl transferase AbiEii toxin, Type IV TA system
MIDLYDEFRRLVTVLEQQSIDYALCGGIAMAVHGAPRATIDIDLVVQPEALGSLIAIATALGYTIRGKDLQFANGAIEIRRFSKIEPESGDLLSIDLLLVTPEILPVWQSRITANWEGGKLSVVSREGLIQMKQLRSSGQDLDDIERLQSGSDNG